MNRKSVKILTVGRIPILVHHSFIVWCLFVTFAFAGFSIPAILAIGTGYTILILLHEFGHATAAKLCGLKVKSIELSGAGGQCKFDPPQTFKSALFTCSGGFLAQLVLLLVILSVVQVFGRPEGLLATIWFEVFVRGNLLLLLSNALPLKLQGDFIATDGFHILRLLWRKLRGQPYVLDASPTFDPDIPLHQQLSLVPEGFTTGIEIFNDNTTPMEFVVDAIARHLNVSEEEAVKLTLEIHQQGGLLIPVDTYEDAVRIADAIADDNVSQGQALLCRAIDLRDAGTTESIVEKQKPDSSNGRRVR